MPDFLRVEYSYLTRPRGEVILRPVLPLRLVLKEVTIDSTGLLDTGADINVLPYQTGVALGADWEKQPLLATLSDNLAQHEAKGIMLSGTVNGFAPVPLVFAWTRNEQAPLILGQVNLFQEFDICFFRAEGAFEVRPKRLGL
jgi:hypothetical protein